jgi:hypothetical protein
MTFTGRLIGAAKLDRRAYEEVEADRTATMQSLAVVVMSSLAAGVGRTDEGLVIGRILASLLTWVIWAGLAYAIGVYLIPEPQTHADFGQMLRTIGFAAAPGILRIFRVVPLLDWLLSMIVGIWLIAAMVVAVRQALDYTSTMRAVVVCLIGWLIAIGMVAIFGSIFFMSARSVLY